MATRAEIITEIRGEVTVMANPDRSHTLEPTPLKLENGHILETHTIPVYVAKKDGTLKPTKRVIAVRYDGDPDEGGTEVDAWPIEPKQVDYQDTTNTPEETDFQKARSVLAGLCRGQVAIPETPSEQVPIACSVPELIGKKFSGFRFRTHEDVAGEVVAVVRLKFLDGTSTLTAMSKSKATGLLQIDEYDG